MTSPAPPAALAALLLALASCGEPAPPPNVVLLLSDQHRWHAMGHTEAPGLATPTLDRLAREGISLRLAVSNAPVCAPARALLLTGRAPHRTGVLDNGDALRPGETTLGSWFRDAGYATGYVGKWHLGGRSARPFGFEHSILWFDSARHWSSRFSVDGGPDTPYDGYNATGTTDQALAFLERHRDGPFLLVASWNPPHPDYTDAPGWAQARTPPPPYRGNVPEDWRREPEAALHHAGYHAHVSAVDAELARVLAKIEELGIAGRTILVYTSDHGDMLGSHGLRQKRLPYDEALRVPFLVRWPGLPPAPRDDLLLGTIDLFPTLCGLAGIPAPAGLAGVDLSGGLRGERGARIPRHQPILHVSFRGQPGARAAEAPPFRGVRTRRYTYAVRADGPWLLFDHREDPLQLDNRARDPDLAERRSELADLTATWLAASGDPFELPPSAWR